MPNTTTLDKAKKCPKCHNYGEQTHEGRTTDPKIKAYVFKCTHKVCLWYDTTWIVTVDEDGKVPMMDIGHTKKIWPSLRKITDEQRRRIRETFDDI